MSWKEKFPKKGRYFETENGILYCGDCLEIIDSFPDNILDSCIQDPPYFLGNKPFKNEDKEYERLVVDWDLQWKDINEYVDWYKEVSIKISKKLKSGGSFLTFGSFHNAMHLKVMLDSLDCFTFRNFITWFIPDAMPIKFAKQIGLYAYSCQYILYYTKGKTAYFDYDFLRKLNGGKQHRDIFIFKNYDSDKGKYKHPSMKPLKLLEILVKAHSPEGGIVLDSFLGSGTTALACEKLNRRWIGIEINEEYCKMAKERLSKMNPLRYWISTARR